MEAVILAGGLGTRLRGVIGEIPKCMAPVDGKPFLQYQLEWLSRFDVRHVVFSVGYLREQVMDFVQGREWPFAVSFAIEKEPLGTGGGIRLALQKCREKQVFVLNGDTFYNVDLNALHFTAPVTLALKPMRDFDRYGAVDWDGDLVTGFREKQPCAEGLINGGVYAIDRSQLDMSLFPKNYSFERDVLEPLVDYGLVAGEVQDGYFIDIGIPEDYARAQRELPEIQAVLKASDAVLACGHAFPGPGRGHKPLASGGLCPLVGAVRLPARCPGMPPEMGGEVPACHPGEQPAGSRQGKDVAGGAGGGPCPDA